MFSFLQKPKMSCLSLAETLAPKFTRMAIHLYDSEVEALGENSWIAESVQRTSQIASKREWVLYCLAGYINGCRASMGENDIHFRFGHLFLIICGRNLVEQSIFPTESEFEKLGQDRTAEYLGAITNDDPEGSMNRVAKAFLINAGCNANDIALRTGAALNFVNESVNTKKLFDEIKRTVRLVPE